MLYCEAIKRQSADLSRVLKEARPVAAQAAERLAQATRLYLCGVGTSFHAAQVGEALLRAFGVDAWAVHSSDFAVHPPPLSTDQAVLVISHEGTTTYSVEAIRLAERRAGTCVCITGVDSAAPDVGLVIRTVQRERSSAHTSSYLAAMAVLAQISLELGRILDAPGVSAFEKELMRLPGRVSEVAEREDEVRVAACRASHAECLHFLGSGPNFPTATEGALKVKETAHVRTEGMSFESMLHGPLAAVEADDMAIIIASSGPEVPRMKDVICALGRIGAFVWLVGDRRVVASAELPTASLRFPIPRLLPLLAPIPYVVPLQLLACHLAVARGTNPDTLRRDQPAYRRAMECFKS
jgi:glucosamine--fructose-6-phosphate aminotransferase (isomerizing)